MMNSDSGDYYIYHPNLPKSLQPDCILPLWLSSMNFRRVLKSSMAHSS